jgi:type VI secretion system protein ImpK
VETAGLNPLVGAAGELVVLIGQLRNTITFPDVGQLRQQLAQGIRGFEDRARRRGVGEETITRASYVLCAALDEAVLTTPWGSESSWTGRTLLAEFHNETWGGEKFFALLDFLLHQPAGNVDLIELMYLCMALGFQGRYRAVDGGAAQLDDLRRRVVTVIERQRGAPERTLSPHWKGVGGGSRPLASRLPLWVVTACVLAVLLVAYAGFSFQLNRASDALFPAVHALGEGVATPPAEGRRAVPIAPPPDAVRLRDLLADDLRSGAIEIVDRDDGAEVIRIRGDGLFASGSAAVRAEHRPLLRRIGEALAAVPGTVLVTGHTDNIPIQTLRFPSNWHLSMQRAEAVVAMLDDVIGSPGRLTAEGRADTEPLVPNDSPQNRALNRRVEIALTPGRAAG